MSPSRKYSTWRYLLIMIACYAVWIPGYFFVGWIASRRGAAFDPALPIDASWPFVPEAVFVYLIAYVIVIGLFAVRRSTAFLDHAYLNFIVMNLLGFALFALFPTMGPARTELPTAVPPMLAFMFDLDVQWNAFPSLHVANPTLIAMLAIRERGVDRISLSLSFVALAIAVSTLLVRQHFLLDIVGGMLLAGLVFAGLWRFKSPARD